MKLTFRWYGEKDSIPLSYIRQIPGMTGVVTAVYDVPVGEAWSDASVARLEKLAADAGLGMEVIESIPVHEDIKLGRGERPLHSQLHRKHPHRRGARGQMRML